MPYNIAFDVAHKPRGKLDENLTELRDFLNANDYTCYNFLEAPITRNSLKSFDILVFVCPDFAKISSMEITEINSWVREDGGGLLMLSHAGGDRGRNSNLSELSQTFGITFENDQVLDKTYNLGLENMPIVTAFIPPHPITNSISSLCFRSGCSLSVVGSSISIVSSNETSEPFSTPLICVAEPDKGRVCAIGSYELFRDSVGGGFGNDEHPNLTFNVFSWLVSDYRMELHSSGAIPEIAPQEVTSTTQTMDYQAPTQTMEYQAPPTSSAITERNINFSMKISKKSELIDLLKIFQNQIDTMKTTIDKLIRTVASSETSITELNGPPPIKQQNYPQSDGLDELISSNEPLTDLPKRPESLDQKEDEYFIGLPRLDVSDKLKPAPKPHSKKKVKKKDLLAEKKGLESKLNSVRNLLDFVEKKYTAGQMDKKSYQKRADQLKKDLKVTKNKIEQIDKQL
jgi:peptidoglycan hydrolase CwlO-like protein